MSTKKTTKSKKKYPIEQPCLTKNLDISTGHISPNDGVLLDNSTEESNSPLIVYRYPEGWFVYVPQDDTEEDTEEEINQYKEYGMSEQFCNIIKIASKNKCKYIQFDCDGIEYEDLEIIEM